MIVDLNTIIYLNAVELFLSFGVLFYAVKYFVRLGR